MSNKPPKKSDEKKKWMEPQRRSRNIAIAPEYHLIVSEGTKTEPNYFKALKDEINKNFTGRISIDINGAGERIAYFFVSCSAAVAHRKAFIFCPSAYPFS